MEYTNSLLIDCELRSPYNSGRRTRSIDRITPHASSTTKQTLPSLPMP